MDKKIVYRYKGTDYQNIYDLRKAMPHVSLPNTLTEEQCRAIGVLKLELSYSTDEARAMQLQKIYNDYQAAYYAPTKYKVNGKEYRVQRDDDNVMKFNLAYQVAKIKGDNLFKVIDENGNATLITLTQSDFEGIMLKSAMEQQEAYTRFSEARDAVNKYKRAEKIFSIEF